MKDKFDELGCEFLNESECEEQLDDEGLSLGEAEEAHFGEDDEKKE